MQTSIDYTRTAGADVDLKTAKKTVGQCERVYLALLSGPVVNDLETMGRLQCIRIGARIHDLRTGKHDQIEHPISGDGTPEKPYRLED